MSRKSKVQAYVLQDYISVKACHAKFNEPETVKLLNSRFVMNSLEHD